MLKLQDTPGHDAHVKFLKAKTAFTNLIKKLKQLDLPEPELDELRKGTYISEKGKQLDEYNPGVTKLTRTITLEPDEIKRVKKAIWAVPGIDMKVRGDQVTFRTAKIKTLAKILNKVIDFGATDVGTVLDIPAEIGHISEERKPGDKVKYRNIKTKRNKTGKIRAVKKTDHGTKYELDNGAMVYDQDIEEAKVTENYLPGLPDASKRPPTRNHRPAIWEAMLGTVYAMNDAGEIKSFGRNYEKAIAFSGADDASRDPRLHKLKKSMRFSGESDKTIPAGKLVYFVLKNKVEEKEGGMSDKERKAYNRKHGSNLKRAQPGGGKRRTSYCARSKGQMDDHNIDCRKTPDKPICKARRDWNC